MSVWHRRSKSCGGPAGPRDPRNPHVGCRRLGDFQVGVLLSDYSEHLAERYGALVTGAVNIEGGRAADAARQTTRAIFRDVTTMFVSCQFSPDVLNVKRQVIRVLQQAGVIKRILVREKHVVHFPEPAL